MSGVQVPIYRLPTPRAVCVGHVRVVVDRNNRRYVNGSKVETAATSGAFQVLTLANGEVYYVKTNEYERLAARKK